MYRSKNKITDKIIKNFRKGLITESSMLNQLYDAMFNHLYETDKDKYCEYLDYKYSEECKNISDDCEAEGYPGRGSNYYLRCESLGDSYYKCYGYNPCTGECEWED